MNAMFDLQKLIADFEISTSDETATANITSPINDEQCLIVVCTIGSDARLYGNDDPQWDVPGPGVSGYSVTISDAECNEIKRELTAEEWAVADMAADWLEDQYIAKLEKEAAYY